METNLRRGLGDGRRFAAPVLFYEWIGSHSHEPRVELDGIRFGCNESG